MVERLRRNSRVNGAFTHVNGEVGVAVCVLGSAGRQGFQKTHILMAGAFRIARRLVQTGPFRMVWAQMRVMLGQQSDRSLRAGWRSSAIVMVDGTKER